MKDSLLSYIDKSCNRKELRSVDELIFILAKMSLIALPVAWAVKRPGNDDILFLKKEGALRFLNNHGKNGDSLHPLYSATAVKLIPPRSNSMQEK